MAVYSRKGQFESINIKFKVKKRDFSMHARVFICSQITSTCLIPVYRRKASWLQTDNIKLIIAIVKHTPDLESFPDHVGSDGRSFEATMTTSTSASPSSTIEVVVTVGTGGAAGGRRLDRVSLISNRYEIICNV